MTDEVTLLRERVAQLERELADQAARTNALVAERRRPVVARRDRAHERSIDSS